MILKHSPPTVYAPVGMTAVLAGTVRAPLTAIILLFEQTRNYEIILPLMLSIGMSAWLVDVAKSSQTIERLDMQQIGINLEKMT